MTPKVREVECVGRGVDSGGDEEGERTVRKGLLKVYLKLEGL